MKNYLKVFNSPRFFRLVAIGDSTTSQEWCHPNWIDWLSFAFREAINWDKDWRRKIINSGRDGATIEHYLTYFNEEVARFKPHAIIVSLGLNDLLPTLNAQKHETDLRKLLTMIKQTDADIITWSAYAIPAAKYQHDQEMSRDIYKKLTTEFNGVFIDMFAEFQEYDLEKIFTYVQVDGNDVWNIKPGGKDFLHCNLIGNQIIAQKIAREAFNTNLLEWPKLGNMHLIDLSKYRK